MLILGITVEMNLPNYFVNEDDGSVQVCASVVSENLEGTVYLNMSTTDMSATSVSPFDFSAISTEILFNETTSTVCMDILIADDDIVEDPEKFTVGISSFNTDVEYTTQTSNVTITDNDKAVIGFEMEVYKGNEGRMVDVCAMVRNNNTLERSILVIVSIEDVSTNGTTKHAFLRIELCGTCTSLNHLDTKMNRLPTVLIAYTYIPLLSAMVIIFRFRRL